MEDRTASRSRSRSGGHRASAITSSVGSNGNPASGRVANPNWDHSTRNVLANDKGKQNEDPTGVTVNFTTCDTSLTNTLYSSSSSVSAPNSDTVNPDISPRNRAVQADGISSLQQLLTFKTRQPRFILGEMEKVESLEMA